MEFIGVRDFRNKSAAIWKKLNKDKELVITSNGKPVALLSAVNGADIEESLKLLRQARAMAAVRSLHKQSIERGLDRTSLQDVNKVIGDARKGQRGKQ